MSERKLVRDLLQYLSGIEKEMHRLGFARIIRIAIGWFETLHHGSRCNTLLDEGANMEADEIGYFHVHSFRHYDLTCDFMPCICVHFMKILAWHLLGLFQYEICIKNITVTGKCSHFYGTLGRPYMVNIQKENDIRVLYRF